MNKCRVLINNAGINNNGFKYKLIIFEFFIVKSNLKTTELKVKLNQITTFRCEIMNFNLSRPLDEMLE